MPLLLLFMLPVLELWLLIKVGGVIGALPTIALLILSAVVGMTIIRKQGFATLLRANQKMAAGEVPAQEMAEGLFLVVGGVLLLIPGFFTDVLGLVCLIPGMSKLLLGRTLQRWMTRSQGRFSFRAGGFSQAGTFRQGQTYDQPPESHSVDSLLIEAKPKPEE